MTSSLVGSEMCIRDSLWLVPSSGGCVFDGNVDPGIAGGTLIGSTTVSYTHLTLPTICSV
eukprot:3580467-Prorocentrum_lima.AAC.1